MELNKIEELMFEISEKTKTSEKLDVVLDNKDDKDFMKVLKFLTDKNIKSGISRKKISKDVHLVSQMIASDIWLDSIGELCDYLEKHNSGRDTDIAVVKNFIAFKGHDIFVMLLATQELKLGLTAKSINKVIPGFAQDFSVMLAKSYWDNIDKVSGKFILTTKLDGIRLIAVKESDNITFYTRQGKIVDGLVDIEYSMRSFPEGMYDGELLAIDGNFKETTKRARIKGVKKDLCYNLFDYVTLESFYNKKDYTPCNERKSKLSQIIFANQVTLDDIKYIKYVNPLYYGENLDAIEQLLDRVVNSGEEGLMLNMAEKPYDFKRTNSLLKIKKFKDGDMLVTDLIEGEGKLAGTLGSIIVEFEYKGKPYKCNVGSGFNEEERNLYWNNKDLLLGKIVTIKYFEFSHTDNTYSLRFPTWIGRIREDKSNISMY